MSLKGFALLVGFTDYSQAKDMDDKTMDNVDTARALVVDVESFLTRDKDNGEWSITSIKTGKDLSTKL